jgi:hypothetical protein
VVEVVVVFEYDPRVFSFIVFCEANNLDVRSVISGHSDWLDTAYGYEP